MGKLLMPLLYNFVLSIALAPCRYPLALPHGGRATGSVILVDLHDNSLSSTRSTRRRHSPLKSSDANLPPWIINEETEPLYNYRRNHPVLAPSLNLDRDPDIPFNGKSVAYP